MSTPNTIDYSNLNKSLQPKRKVDSITKDIAEEIGKVFLAKNTHSDKVDVKNRRIEEFASDIENGSENMKIKFALTINYLAENNLLNPESIKSLKIKGKTSDEKLQNILDDLIINDKNRKTPISESQKAQLNQAVANGIENHYSELANKEDVSEDLKARNSELEEELAASEAANEVVETAILKRRSRNNMVRVGNSIKNIGESSLDPVTKARKILWQANSFALLGTGKRFDWINKLPKKIDVNKEYKEAVDNLMNRMDKTDEPKEKVAIRYIMRQINKAYKDYLDATSISDETRRQNMKDINMKMAA